MGLTNWQLFFLDLQNAVTDQPIEDNEVLTLIRTVNDPVTLIERGGRALYDSIRYDVPNAWFRFNEVTGAVTVADSSGNGALGLPNTGVTFGFAEGVPGGDTIASFDGSTGGNHGTVDIGRNAALQAIVDIFTLEAWVTPFTAQNYNGTGKGVLFSNVAAGTTPLFWLGNDNKLHGDTGGGSSVVVSSTLSFSLVTRHHVAWTKNGATNKLYWDGVDVTSSVTNVTMTSSLSSWKLGSTGANFFFNGGLDNMVMFDRALSSAQIAQRYAMGQLAYSYYTVMDPNVLSTVGRCRVGYAQAT